MAIYYKCPDFDTPFGGIRAMYRHVDVLVAAGIEAYVLHTRSPFRCTWFEHDTPIRYVHDAPLDPPVRDLLAGRARVGDPVGRLRRAIERRLRGVDGARRLAPDDLLAVSEVIGFRDYRLFPGVPRVIFNQGVYQTFIRWEPDDDPYAREDVVGLMTVSEDSEAYLRLAFGARGRPIVRVHYSLDPAVFAQGGEKTRTIAYVPGKNANDVRQVVSILRLRGALDDWQLIALDGMTERQVAVVLREAALFLSFGHPEGFGRPPLEALACGCAVVGYHGLGGREFFVPELGTTAIEPGDVRAYVEAVERFVHGYEEQREQHLAKGRAAARYVAETYSPAREAREVVAAWEVFRGEADLNRDRTQE